MIVAALPANPWGYCPCGHLWMRHDVNEYSGDGSETCCVEGCSQHGCPGHKEKSLRLDLPAVEEVEV